MIFDRQVFKFLVGITFSSSFASSASYVQVYALESNNRVAFKNFAFQCATEGLTNEQIWQFNDLID